MTSFSHNIAVLVMLLFLPKWPIPTTASLFSISKIDVHNFHFQSIYLIINLCDVTRLVSFDN